LIDLGYFHYLKPLLFFYGGREHGGRDHGGHDHDGREHGGHDYDRRDHHDKLHHGPPKHFEYQSILDYPLKN
tara:strand:- start:61 stop:276 length:216 start_codon:yes stop_codon:yes gene_type:complete